MCGGIILNKEKVMNVQKERFKSNLKLHVVYNWHKGVASWIDRYNKGLTPEKMPYGFHGLERFGYILSWKDSPSSPLLSALRRLMLAVPNRFFVPLDLVNVLSQINEIRNSDLVLTRLDADGMAVALLRKLKFWGKDSRKKHFCFLIWFTDNVTGVSGIKKAILRWIASGVDLFIVLQSSQIEAVAETLSISSDKILFLPRCVDVEFFQSRDSFLSGDYILSIGGDRDRDYSTLLRSVKDKPLHLNLAVRKWCEVPSEIPENVSVLWEVPIYKLRDIYAKSKFVVITCGPNTHGSGTTTLLEAMAMGKATIISRTQGFHDYFVEGETAITVKPGDPVELSEAIDFLWNHPEECERMGKNARRLVEEKFTIDKVSERLAGGISSMSGNDV